jgi:hypothetical protein
MIQLHTKQLEYWPYHGVRIICRNQILTNLSWKAPKNMIYPAVGFIWKIIPNMTLYLQHICSLFLCGHGAEWMRIWSRCWVDENMQAVVATLSPTALHDGQGTPSLHILNTIRQELIRTKAWERSNIPSPQLLSRSNIPCLLSHRDEDGANFPNRHKGQFAQYRGDWSHIR